MSFVLKKELYDMEKFHSPENAVMPIDKVSSNFFGSGNMGSPEEVLGLMKEAENQCNKYNCSGINILVSGRNAPEVAVKNCYIAVTDAIDKIAGVKMSRTLTQDELMVFTAVCSLIDAGNLMFSPKQIYSAITGRKGDSINNSDPIIRSIEKAMMKLMCTIVRFDWTDQAIAWKVEGLDVKSCYVNANLLYAKQVNLQLWNGSEISGYIVKEVPDLFNYIKAIKQYVLVKRDVLNIDIVMTNRNIRIRDYIIKKIERVKSNNHKKNRTSDTFRFDTMIEKCQLEVNNSRARKDIRDASYKILDCYVKMGYIKNYAKNIGKNGRTVESVRVIV